MGKNLPAPEQLPHQYNAKLHTIFSPYYYSSVSFSSALSVKQSDT